MKTMALVLLPMALMAAARGGPHRHGDFDVARVDQRVTEHLVDALDDLKATEAQRARILAIKNRLLPEVGAMAASQKLARQELVAQLSSDRPDPARLHALVDKQIAELRALAHKSVDGVVEAHGTLTPEQRAPLIRKMNRYAAR